MDNNFDENNNHGNEDSPLAGGSENSPAGTAPEGAAAGETVTNGQENTSSPESGYTGQTNYSRYAPGSGSVPPPPPPANRYEMPPVYPPQPDQGYIPPVNGVSPQGNIPPAKKRKLSGGCLWMLLITAIALFGVIIILSAEIAAGKNGSDVKQKTDREDTGYDNLITQPASHTEIVIPTSPRPVLDEKYYEDESTGLLTPVGVAQKILPSQVKIEIFGEMPYAPLSSGSGVVISSDGYILTNAHVIDGAKSIAVTFYDDSSERAFLAGMDRKTDLAVIKVRRDDLTAAEIGTSSDLVIGEEVAIAGAGGGFANTVTYGHITGLERTIDTNYISSSSVQCIQTDAALNPGNSGGALVNMYGQVVGIAVALMNHETYENIGFSIAIDDAVPIAEDLISDGYVTSRSKIGISFTSIGDAAAESYGVMSGLCVLDIDPECAVFDTEIMPYDVITHIDGTRVFGSSEIAGALEGFMPGDTVTLTVFRKYITGETEIFDVPVELAADTNSSSGYNESISEEDFVSRDIIR